MKYSVVQSQKGFRGLVLADSGLKRWTSYAPTFAEALGLLAEKVKRFYFPRYAYNHSQTVL